MSQATNTGLTLKGMAPLLQVFDMPTSLHFYRDILGFEVISLSSDAEGDKAYWALLKHSGIEVMLNEMYERDQRPAEADGKRMEAHNDTSIYFGCPNVDAAYDYLTSKGLTLKKPFITGYNFKAISVKDPDGYPLVFHWPVQQQ
jgi:uncharacterized glyoxalase superfamily protein PhnB